jgi:DNA primase
MSGTRRVLYHLPEILAAETVYIVEGEKDADKLVELTLDATTNPGGAGKWDPDFSECLKDKNVVILPDNDEVGQNHAAAVAKNLLAVTRSVKIIRLPDLPAKGDVSDYLSSHSKEELLALVKASAPLTIPLESQGTFWPEPVSYKVFKSQPMDATRWLWKDTLPIAATSLLVGKPRDGKTTFALNSALAISPRCSVFEPRYNQVSGVLRVH